MQRKKSKVANRFAAATEANKGRVYSDTGKNYNLKKDYPFRLNFYLKPPPMEITVEEFEVFALDRLQGKKKKREQHTTKEFKFMLKLPKF